MTTNATAFTNVVGKDFICTHLNRPNQQAGGGALANGDMIKNTNNFISKWFKLRC